MKHKLLFIIVDRANYGRLMPLILAGYKDNRFIIQTCFTGTTLSDKFGKLINDVSQDGIEVNFQVNIEESFRSHEAMLNTISNGIVKMQELYKKVNPDAVVIIGDRYEALGCAIAAVYRNIYLIHLQGGEMSGSIDETTRHVITKMAHLHFPSTERAAKIIKKMGENPKHIINSGCPVGDLILSSKTNLNSLVPFYSVDNIRITSDDIQKGFALACLHPVTTGIENSLEMVKIIKEFLMSINYPIIWITPNADPGSNSIFKEIKTIPNCHLVVNLNAITFQLLLRNAKFALGNSSSFVRDSTFTGTPILLLGLRQKNRETHKNVTLIEDISVKKLQKGLENILSKPRPNPSFLYGNGKASLEILNGIDNFLNIKPTKQKQLHYSF